MSLETLIVWLIVGGVAGWLATLIMKSGGLRLTGNHLADTIITGIIGAFSVRWACRSRVASSARSSVRSLGPWC
jgi:uncharacterized membrane protein YeaQ/YmgE (transglycosylase-associated protein family)